MTDLYVYYKVRTADAVEVARRVRALQSAMADGRGVVGQLKRRPEVRDGLETWMEVYPDVYDGFSAHLEAAVRAISLPRRLASPRHSEVFMDLTPCA